MEDQIGFELVMERMKVINDWLQLYGPLSPPSSDGWDGVGSSSSSGGITDRLSEEATLQSLDVMESMTQVASIFQFAEDLAQIQPSLNLPKDLRDYELVAYDPSIWVTGDSGEGCFFMYQTLFTQMKLELPFPFFYCGVLLVLQMAPVQIHLNGVGVHLILLSCLLEAQV